MPELYSERLRARYSEEFWTRSAEVSRACYLLRYDTTLTAEEINAQLARTERWCGETNLLSEVQMQAEGGWGNSNASFFRSFQWCETCQLMTSQYRGDCHSHQPEEWCTSCNEHNYDCACTNCDNCGDRHNDCCGDCQRCGDCGCNCNEEDEEEREGSQSIHQKPTTFPADHPVNRTLFHSKRLAGVEIEYVECDDFSYLKAHCKEWGAGIHADGSCGWELVTSPAAGNHLVHHVKDSARALEKSGAQCSPSCGVHVHVDARDFVWADMTRLLAIWRHVEPAMYILGGQKRIQNKYSRPMKDTVKTESKDAFARSLWGSEVSFGDLKSARQRYKNIEKKGYGSERYKSLNVMPWVARLLARETATKSGDYKWNCRTVAKADPNKPSKFKRYIPDIRTDATVEFRLHEGTHNSDELLNWTKLCVEIVDYAARATEKEVAALPVSAFRALTVIAPKSTAYIVAGAKKYHKTAKLTARLLSYRPTAKDGKYGGKLKWRIEVPKRGWALRELKHVAKAGEAGAAPPLSTTDASNINTTPSIGLPESGQGAELYIHPSIPAEVAAAIRRNPRAWHAIAGERGHYHTLTENGEHGGYRTNGCTNVSPPGSGLCNACSSAMLRQVAAFPFIHPSIPENVANHILAHRNEWAPFGVRGHYRRNNASTMTDCPCSHCQESLRVL